MDGLKSNLRQWALHTLLPASGCGIRFLPLPLAALLLSAAVASADIPIIDAHSQVDHLVKLEKVIKLMDKAGVSRTILSTRGKVSPDQLISFAENNPGRITPAVRTKGGYYVKDKPKYYKLLQQQMSMPEFGAMAELILWHAAKFNRKGEQVAPKWVVHPEQNQVQRALKGALSKGWPFIFHIEFGEIGADRDEFTSAMKTMIRKHPAHPFGMIHMGQLGVEDARQWIEAHPNLFFLTSHANTIVVKTQKRHPWTNMFSGRKLTPEWKALVTRYPNRFVMAFDNVFPNHWGKYYLKQVALWRKALADLPPDVAHALAHGNAERLWRLPAAQ